MGVYEVVMVILTIVIALMGVVGKLVWNKIGVYDRLHQEVKQEVKDIDDRLVARMNRVESRATTLESTIVTKDDLFNLVNTLREDGVRRDERMYDKLEALAAKVEALLYERSRNKHNP